MKIWSQANRRTVASAAIIFFFANTTCIHAGIISLLRGETTVPEQQRVAFVGAAEVKEVTGAVERLAGVDRWENLSAGARLFPGDVIRTAAGTAILCMCESKSFVKLTPNTLLRLVDFETGWDRGIVSGCEERSGFVVRSCRGNAYFADANGSWRPVEVNQVLAPGTALRTDAGVIVDLFHNALKRPLRVPGSARIKLDEQLLARTPFKEPTYASAQH
jgi:hypothetical protein